MERNYPVIRPAFAAWLSGVTLVAALVIGVALIRSLSATAEAVRLGGEAANSAHAYTAALEAWRDADTARPGDAPRQDSVRAALTVQFKELRAELSDPTDAALVDRIIAGLRASDAALAREARTAMVGFLARQRGALLAAAEAAQRAQRYATVLLALAAIGVAVLIVPLAWLWVRHNAPPDGTAPA
jgi:hypothetical protein